MTAVMLSSIEQKVILRCFALCHVLPWIWMSSPGQWFRMLSRTPASTLFACPVAWLAVCALAEVNALRAAAW